MKNSHVSDNREKFTEKSEFQHNSYKPFEIIIFVQMYIRNLNFYR